MEEDSYTSLKRYINFLEPGFCDTQTYKQIDVSTSQIILGVIAMDKKIKGGPFKEILQMLERYDSIKILIIEQKTFLNQAVEDWPRCDALITFFSGGFPFSKVLRYVYMHRPLMLNNLYFQRFLWDRRIIYSILKYSGIPTPPHLILERKKGEEIDNEEATYSDPRDIHFKKACDKVYRELFDKLLTFDTPEIEESADHNKDDEVLSEDPVLQFVEYENGIEIGHRVLKKAFVEKPINAEDHNINIYYTSDLGGGHKKLFRKTDNLSSKFFPEQFRIRENDSFIYEEYLQTDGFDIKVYTVGSHYAHANKKMKQ